MSRAAAGGFVALLAVAGPFADGRLRRSPFAHHDDYLAFYMPRGELARQEIPDFYRRLATSAAAGPVLEVPWLPVWRMNRAFYLYQEIHRQDVVVASPRIQLWDPRLSFRNMVPLLPERLLASRVRYLVVHRDLSLEESRVRDRTPRPRSGLVEVFHGVLAENAHATGRLLKRRWGDPDYADESIQVWDLARLRRGG